ncbi:hypothetical protein FQR65_LT02758 [Abscondita terminalis]|nr:hypothetical protein FQR65_LT02758 [Abscondita terminalis]
MSCNLDLIISSVVLNYLNTIDKNIGKLFQEKTKAFCLAKGSPVITDVFNHFIQTNSKSRKIKFIAVGDEQSTSEDEAIPEINLTGDNCITSVKVETSLNINHSKINEYDMPYVQQLIPSTSKENVQVQNDREPQFYIDRNSSGPQQDQIMVNEFSRDTFNYDSIDVGNVDNYQQYGNYYNDRSFYHPGQPNVNQNKSSSGNYKKLASKKSKIQNIKMLKLKRKNVKPQRRNRNWKRIRQGNP